MGQHECRPATKSTRCHSPRRCFHGLIEFPRHQIFSSVFGPAPSPRLCLQPNDSCRWPNISDATPLRHSWFGARGQGPERVSRRHGCVAPQVRTAVVSCRSDSGRAKLTCGRIGRSRGHRYRRVVPRESTRPRRAGDARRFRSGEAHRDFQDGPARSRIGRRRRGLRPAGLQKTIAWPLRVISHPSGDARRTDSNAARAATAASAMPISCASCSKPSSGAAWKAWLWIDGAS